MIDELTERRLRDDDLEPLERAYLLQRVGRFDAEPYRVVTAPPIRQTLSRLNSIQTFGAFGRDGIVDLAYSIHSGVTRCAWGWPRAHTREDPGGLTHYTVPPHPRLNWPDGGAWEPRGDGVLVWIPRWEGVTQRVTELTIRNWANTIGTYQLRSPVHMLKDLP